VLGDTAAALRTYDESLAVLEPHGADSEVCLPLTARPLPPLLEWLTESGAQAQHALTVTLNKKGDLLWHAGGLQDALPLYARSAAIRAAAVAAADDAPADAAPLSAGRVRSLYARWNEQRSDVRAQVADAALGAAKLADALATAGQRAAAADAARSGIALLLRLRARPDAEARLEVWRFCCAGEKVTGSLSVVRADGGSMRADAFADCVVRRAAAS
jgi:hypothetical protein